MKSLIHAFIMTLGVVGVTTTSILADPWKDESGKFRKRFKEWNKDRSEDIREWEKNRREAAREWEKDRREAAREWDKKHHKRWRDRPRAYYELRPNAFYEDYGPLPPPYEYRRYAPRYETHYRYRFDDDFAGRWGDDDYQRFRARHRPPFYEKYEPYDSYYRSRSGDIGAWIGSRIGGAIGGPEGAAIGADIGAEIETEVDD